jgi:stearoyl-CoA desaturase (delta-9 desaturase)
MAAQGPILFWAATHRMHHVFTDQDGDPHSPRVLLPGLRGRVKALWHAHQGC